jgi:NTP pyrophosphatase (non-canonical NTP hydrolase)
MLLDHYQIQALRTAKVLPFNMDLIHTALGLTGEAGEFADAVKKHVIYDKPLDRTNLLEEMGDILWYIALGCNSLGVTMTEVAAMNVAKLKERYPDRYTDADAIARADK